MAEVRKVRPGKGGHIAQAIAKAMGESVRPITPGGSPDPSKASETVSQSYAVTSTSFVVNDTFLMPSDEDEAESPDRDRPDA